MARARARSCVERAAARGGPEPASAGERRRRTDVGDPGAAPASRALGRRLLGAGPARAVRRRSTTTKVHRRGLRAARPELPRRGEPREPPRHGAREGRARRGGRAARRARRARLLLRHAAQARLLRELHQPHPDGAGGLAASRACAAAAEALRRGYHLLIFPEGTRSRDGELAPFYPTAGYLALHCGVDVCRSTSTGTHEALPPGEAPPAPGAELEVRFGQPIPVDGAAPARPRGCRAATRTAPPPR